MHDMDRQSDKHGSKDDNLPGMQDNTARGIRGRGADPNQDVIIRHRWGEALVVNGPSTFHLVLTHACHNTFIAKLLITLIFHILCTITRFYNHIARGPNTTQLARLFVNFYNRNKQLVSLRLALSI